MIGTLLCSIYFHSFGALVKAVRLYMASFHNQPSYHKICSIDIFVTLHPEIWKWDFSTPRFGGPCGVGDGPIRYPAHGFLLASLWHIWVIYLKSASACPTRIRWQMPLLRLSLRRVAKIEILDVVVWLRLRHLFSPTLTVTIGILCHLDFCARHNLGLRILQTASGRPTALLITNCTTLHVCV